MQTISNWNALLNPFREIQNRKGPQYLLLVPKNATKLEWSFGLDRQKPRVTAGEAR